MSPTRAERIASTLLYEGYMLYPYRASAVKNRQRFNFGVLAPEGLVGAEWGADASAMQTECLIEGRDTAAVAVKVRFLHLVSRTVGRLRVPTLEPPRADDSPFEMVDRLTIDDRLYQSWQEAVEREVVTRELTLRDLCAAPRIHAFGFPTMLDLEPLHDAAGLHVGVIGRRQHAITGELEMSARPRGQGIYAVRVRIANVTSVSDRWAPPRDEALLHSLVSTHTILTATGGTFVSLLDPPPSLRDAVATCRNIGTWPVLAGEPGSRDTMLSSPIVIYDNPEVAPESPGDLFDSLEIDEILSLRILTLTDEEKREMASVDERSRRLLERTEALAAAQMMDLHGVMRPVEAEG